jgi:hypothetical protein
MRILILSRSALRLLPLALISGAVLLINGCAAMATMPISSLLNSGGSPPYQVLQVTQVRLDQQNFVVAKTNVVGQSKGFSLLGFITIVPAKLDTAMNRMYAHAQVQEGQPQTIANVVTEQNSSYFILFGIPHTTVRADLIKFTSPPPTVTQVQTQAAPSPETKAGGEQPGK